MKRLFLVSSMVGNVQETGTRPAWTVPSSAFLRERQRDLESLRDREDAARPPGVLGGGNSGLRRMLAPDPRARGISVSARELQAVARDRRRGRPLRCTMRPSTMGVRQPICRSGLP